MLSEKVFSGVSGNNGPTAVLAATNKYRALTVWVRLEDMRPWPGAPGRAVGQRPLDTIWVGQLADHFLHTWFAPTVFPMIGVARFEDHHLPQAPAQDGGLAQIPTLQPGLSIDIISGNHRRAAAALYLVKKIKLAKDEEKGDTDDPKLEPEPTVENVLDREDAKWPVIILRQGRSRSPFISYLS